MTKTFQIDINADVGEGIGNESEIIPFLSSCNIACGGHAGNLETMTKVVMLAHSQSVKIGAHPSFPDRLNFGRIDMKISAADLYSSLKEQIRALQNVLHSKKAQLYHVKPHGALYNLAVKDEKTAAVIIEVIKSIATPLKLYAPCNSVISKIAILEGVEVVYEAFADRNYNEDLSLVSRQNENAILDNNAVILNHVLGIIKHQKVKTISGLKVPIEATTLCVHGDTRNAVDILKFLNHELPKNGIEIQ